MQGKFLFWPWSGLPHTQGNAGNFQAEENLSETQGILIYSLNSGKFWFFQQIQGSFKILKFLIIFFLLSSEWDLINLAQYFVQEN